ncbi:MAG: peptide ABC transporter substrate-binding protein [Chloroflexota bacterium]|nr:peptide ABC transporter substrate-binding protein [Chloroflexota bacterium]
MRLPLIRPDKNDHAAAVRLLLLSILLIPLAGCWPLTDGSSSVGTSPSTTPGVRPAGTVSVGNSVDGTAGVSVTPLPSSPDALNIAGDTEDPPSLDPAIATDSYSQLVIRQLFSGLVAFDNDLKIVPDLATSLPAISPDGKTYTFSLRRGVRFPDGSEVTARDFKYSFERATDSVLAGSHDASSLPASIFLGDIVGVQDKLAGKAKEIAGVQAPDPYTLVLTIDAPRAYFLSKLTAGPASVVEKSNVEGSNDWLERPAGTGPFRIEKWVHNQEMVLAANPDYAGGRPRLARVNIWMGASATGELQQYETGGLEIADVPVGDLGRITDRNNSMSRELQTVSDLSATYLGFNLTQKPFDDPKVREAFARAIDAQKVARVMFESRVQQARGFVPPGIAGYSSPDVGFGFDVTRARRLLAESTYKDARNLPRLRLYTSGDSIGPMLSEVFSQTLGVDVEVHEVGWTDYLAGLDQHEYPMFTSSWAADYPDPEAILGTLFRSSSPENSSGYRNNDVDAALSLAAIEPNSARRMATYAQVEERVLRDYPAVPLYHSVRYTLVKPYVQGLKMTSLGILNLKDVRVLAH